MAAVYLIRHARTAGNEQKRYIGITDEPLSNEGIAELNSFIRKGLYPSVEFVYTSPMRRCRETAELIYGDTPQETISEFAECNFGEFEGKTYAELKENQDYRRWIASAGEMDIPGGESAGCFREHSRRGFQVMVGDILRNGFQSAAAVVHGGTIMEILSTYAPTKKSFYEWQLHNCEGFRLIIDAGIWKTDNKISAVVKI